MIVAVPSAAYAATIHVPKDYARIQEAIDVATDGDSVFVDPGTYAENLDFKGKAILVKSTQGADYTTVNGRLAAPVVLFINSEGPDSVLDGFTLRNGDAWAGGYDSGGGIHCDGSSPTIRVCTIMDNHANGGGGIYAKGGSLLIEGNLITDNHAGMAGGIYLDSSHSVVRGNVIRDHFLPFGDIGGIRCNHSDVVIENNEICYNLSQFSTGIRCNGSSPVIRNNKVFHNIGVDGSGAGISCFDGTPDITDNYIAYNGGQFIDGAGVFLYKCTSLVENNTIHGNYGQRGAGVMTAYGSLVFRGNTVSGNQLEQGSGGYEDGGGMSYFSDDSLIENNLFYHNKGGYGGGMYVGGNTALLRNNVFHGNTALSRGGGITFSDWYPASHQVINCTFHENEATDMGSGLCFDGDNTVTVANTILYDCDAPVGTELWIGSASASSTVTIHHCNVNGGLASVYKDPGCTLNWGAGMIDADPRFVIPGIPGFHDFHVMYSSPCRDAGDSTVPGLPLTDFEGDPRIAEGAADIGADEFYTHLYFNGDAVPGSSIEITIVGLPSATPVFLWLGSGVLHPPMNTKYGYWRLEFPLLMTLDLYMIPPPEGILVLPVFLPYNVPTPLSLPLQALVEANLTNLCEIKVE